MFLARDHMYVSVSIRGWAKCHFRAGMSCFAASSASVFCTKLHIAVSLGKAGYSCSFIPIPSDWGDTAVPSGQVLTMEMASVFLSLFSAKFVSWWHWQLPLLVKHGNISSFSTSFGDSARGRSPYPFPEARSYTISQLLLALGCNQTCRVT